MTGTQQIGTISPLTYHDSFTRLRERLRIQRLTDPRDPDYRKRTRQLLLQLDEYPDKTPCMVVSHDELDRLLALGAV